MAKDMIEVNLATADAIPASFKFEHLTSSELEAALQAELEACEKMTEWPSTNRY